MPIMLILFFAGTMPISSTSAPERHLPTAFRILLDLVTESVRVLRRPVNVDSILTSHHSVMGEIPAKTNMVSTVILSPQNLQDINANESFNVSLQVANLQAGSFTNATSTYYSAPQALNSAGDIIGHVHVTIQDMGGSLNPTTPPDPTTFAFFKGIDDAGNGQGLLQAAVTDGLAAGVYRVCTMSSSSNHQPVLMPVSAI